MIHIFFLFAPAANCIILFLSSSLSVGPCHSGEKNGLGALTVPSFLHDHDMRFVTDTAYMGEQREGQGA